MENQYDVIVIGSGFGGTIMALTIAREFYLESIRDPAKPKRKVLLMERGTWWTTPVGTVADKEIGTYTKLRKKHGQPVQFWSSNNSFRGVIDLLTRCLYHPKKNPDGLYQLTRFGTTGIFKDVKPGIEGLTVLRANGVGGGSLVYSNITEQPPDLIFNNEAWKSVTGWDEQKDKYFGAARTAIGVGILKALTNWDNEHALPLNYTPAQIDAIKKEPDFQKQVNTGLSQIVTRSAGLNPHWKQVQTDGKWDFVKNKKGDPLYQYDSDREGKDPLSPNLPSLDDKHDFKNDMWVDRARIFQKAVSKIADANTEFSANTLSINDYDTRPLQVEKNDPAGSNLYGKVDGKAANYCERHGRCNVGCLPGARHTLNKQLMAAVYGPVQYKKDPNGNLSKESDGHFILNDTKGILDGFLEIEALCEVDYINKIGEGQYEVLGWKHTEQSVKTRNEKKSIKVSAPRVVVAAGCLGTNEIMLRSLDKGGLNNLSGKLGQGFSTNGDNFYLLGQTKERVRSTRGPAQSSHAFFNLQDPGTSNPSENLFHMIEDLGLPPAFATTIGFGRKLAFQLANGQSNIIVVIYAVLKFGLGWVWKFIRGLGRNRFERQEMFQNEDEVSANFLAVTSTGREQAKGRIRLGKSGETPLRIERLNEKDQLEPFLNDPVYKGIAKTLNKLETELADGFAPDPNDRKFIPLGGGTIGCSHPLGGCAIGADSTKGVVDEFGHVYDTSKGSTGIHTGLYIADASVIPTSLGVNPSLTISALCWHFANNIRKELV